MTVSRALSDKVVAMSDGSHRVSRGADPAKDQSYVLHMLDQERLARTLLPIGGMHKSEVREHAARIGSIDQTTVGTVMHDLGGEFQ